jgi:hypothetical protein
MKRILVILLLIFLLPMATSAYINNYTVDLVPVLGTFAFTGGNGHAIAKNSSGTRYVTYMSQDSGNNVYKLAWSSDGGVTWTNSIIGPVNGYGIVPAMAEIAIDSSDRVHLVYTTDTGFLEYRNYSSAGGFGTVVVLNSTATTNNGIPSIAVDSHDTVHVVYSTDQGYFYSNISPSSGIGTTPYNLSAISNDCGTMYPALEVDQHDIVHIIRGVDLTCGGGPYQARYINLSSTGWGNEFNMTNPSPPEPTYVWGVLDMVVDANRIHVLYRDSVAGTQYANTSSSANFMLSTPIAIQTFMFNGASMSQDMDGILHFVSQRGSALRYYNFSSAGLSPMVILYPSGGGHRGPRLLWNAYPSGNIVSSGYELLFSKDSISVNYTMYGPDPVPPTPTPVPTSPFNSVSMDLTSQLIQMVIMIGLMLLVLAAIAMLILGYLPD